MSSKLRILRIKKNTGTNSQKMSQACESVKESMFTQKINKVNPKKKTSMIFAKSSQCQC